MKRSEINQSIKEVVDFLDELKFRLPPFAFWSPEEWAAKKGEINEIQACMLGWDITDFGCGDFAKTGLTLFTLRNGHLSDPRYTHKTYCEKILVSQEQQVTPMHFHWNKVEDIINRGGGELVIQLFNSTADDQLSDSDVVVSIDGVLTKVKAGDEIVLVPGQGVCMPQRLYHSFWARQGTGPVLIGEVSKVNDDNVDNRFYEKTGRFPVVEEDQKPLYLLFTEYPFAE